MFAVFALAAIATSEVAAQEEAAAGHPTGVTDCRAGCSGRNTGCREITMIATITAAPGMVLLPDSMKVVKQWNAPDSPGLAGTPVFLIITRYPKDSPRPYTMTVKPDLSTCVGRDMHTQGVTFYELQVLQQPGKN
jgi:hypothetical protein